MQISALFSITYMFDYKSFKYRTSNQLDQDCLHFLPSNHWHARKYPQGPLYF